MAKNKTKTEQHNNKQPSAVHRHLSAPSKETSFLTNFWIQSAFLTLICFVFYANTFRNGYAVDDFLIIDKNEAVNQGVAGIPKLLTSDVFESYYNRYNANNQLSGGRYRPLALVTYALEQQIFGKTHSVSDKTYSENDPNLIYVQHVNNVLLYILSVILLLYFFRKVVFPAQPLMAFLSVFLFTIHPIHTEVVANIKSRDEILSMLFIILTLINTYFYAERHKPLSLVLAMFFFFLALLSKEYAVNLILIIPLMFYVVKKSTLIDSFKKGLPFIGVFVLYIFIRHSFVPINSGQEENELLNNPYMLASGTQIIATKIATLLHYLKLLLFPHPLSVDYSYQQIPYVNITDLVMWMSLIFHVFLSVALVFLTKKRHILAIAIAIYLFNLLLISNLFFSIGATMGERLIYHSSLGFSIAVAYFIYLGYQKMKSKNLANLSFAALMILLLVLTGAKTRARNRDWESNSTLYRKDVMVAENSAVTNANAGNAYLQLAPLQINETAKREVLNKAMYYLNKAIAIYPGYTLAYINRGNVFFQLGDLVNAKQDWDTAKQQYPTHPDLPGLFTSYYINNAINNFGSKGKYYEAIEELNKGAALSPENTILLFNLGYYYNMVGKKDAAINAFQQIIAINPHDSLAIKCASYIDILKKSP